MTIRKLKVGGVEYEAIKMYNAMWCTFVADVGYLKAYTLTGLRKMIKSTLKGQKK